MWRGGKSAPRWRVLAVVLAVAWCGTVLADGCLNGAFQCADKSQCIDASLVQDGVADCKDGSDEACRPLQFRCPCITGADGKRGPRCLEPEMVRDGVEDCADGADERLSSSPSPEEQCQKDKEPSLTANQVVRSKRRASEVSTRIDGPVTTSMFAHEGSDRRLRPTGILTSTAGTFVLDGTTTEFATKVYGTHLEGGVYAKIVSTSSRVFFAVPSAGSMARIRPTGLLSSATSTRVDGSATTLYTTEFSGTYIDGTYAQLVSSTSRVVQGSTAFIEPTASYTSTEAYQTATPTPPIPQEEILPTKEDISDTHHDEVVTVTGTRGALVDGGETKYDVFTGTHIQGDKTYLFFFGNTALSPTAEESGGASSATSLPAKASELVVQTGADDRIVVNVDNKQLNLVLPKSARASAAESESGMKDQSGKSSGMQGVFIEGSEALEGFSIRGVKEDTSRAGGPAPTEMLTVTVGRGVAQTRIVRGRYDGLGEKELETEIRGNVSPSRVSMDAVATERTVYRFAPRIPALRPPRPSLGGSSNKIIKDGVSTEAMEEEESENLLKARKLESKEDGPSFIRPSKVNRINLPTFTVGQDGLKVEEESKVVVRVDHNVEARVGPRKEYRTLSSRQRLGKALPFRGFQVIHEKEDLVNAESGGSAVVPTITYVGFAEFTTTAHGTVIVFMPRSKEVAPSTSSVAPKITAVSAYNRPSSKLPISKDGPAYSANSITEQGKPKVATGIKTFYSHTPGMVTRTVTGHSISMQTTLPTILVEPVFGISTHGREKNGRSEGDLSDAQLVYPTSDSPEEIHTTEGREELDLSLLEPSVSQPIGDVTASTPAFIENAHARPIALDIDSSIASIELSSSSVFESDDSSSKDSEPLKPSVTSLEATETLPVGLIKSIGGERAVDGTTTYFTSLIYGTYINGHYAQIIQTTTSIQDEVAPTELPTTPDADTTERSPTEGEESVTIPSHPTEGRESDTAFVTKEILEESTPAAMTTINDEYDDVMSTIPSGSGTTEENEIANEVETGRRVNNRPEEQVFVVDDDASKEMISALGKGAPSESQNEDAEEVKPSLLYTIIPTTIYQTYTYFTTFFIPNSGTTSTSIRSREVTSSELALLTRSYTATPTASSAASTTVPSTEPTTQSDQFTTPMVTVTEETPELPQDRITTLSEESITIKPAATTPKTPSKDSEIKDDEDSSESDEEEDSEEIELIFKTLYTTYTYLTTFFHDTSTSVSSREVVVTNVLTSTLNNVNLATEPALAGLVRDHDLSTSLPSPSYSDESEEDIPTSVGVGRPTTKFFSEPYPTSSTPTAPLLSTPSIDLEEEKVEVSAEAKAQLRTFYTTYTYFTTIFVDGETEISSRTEVYTNIITPTGILRPSTTANVKPVEFTSPAESSLLTENTVELENSIRPSITVPHQNRYSSTIMRRGSSKSTVPTVIDTTTESLESQSNSEQDSVSISSEKHEAKQRAGLEEFQNDDSTVKFETTTSKMTSVFENSEGNLIITTEKYFGVTKFDEVGEPEKLVSEEDDQEISESNTEVVLPGPLPSPTPNQVQETSLLLQTTFTTFTYFTTLYRGGTSDIISRLETVTNVMAVTVEPTLKSSEIVLPTESYAIKPSSTKAATDVKTTDLPESLYPITYFTTFTYWTTAYKGSSSIVTSREETVSNVVTPTGKVAITKEVEIPSSTPLTETIKPTVVEPVPVTTTTTPIETTSQSLDPSPPVAATPQLTTFYTTYTYFTTSYVGDSTIVRSRLETVTNVEADDSQTARAIGASPAVQQQIIKPTKTTEMPTGLLKTIRRSSVGDDSRTTVFSTDVYGTYIDGRYAQVLESSTQVLIEPSSTSTPNLVSVNLQPTGVVSLNAGSIVDADGLATTYFSTMAIGTYIGDLYAQVVESTSSIVIDPTKTSIPVNTASQRTGLVRLIQGSIVKGDSTTFYESKVIGTVADGRYAQIIESTSSFKASEATKAPESNAILPSSTSTSLLTATVAPTLESSLGEVGSSATTDKYEGGNEEEDEDDEGDGERDGDDEDGNNQGRGRVTSRLTFPSRKRTFTPVIRPFSSRNRPSFNPRRRPTSATTITRVTQTPTVTATPAHTGDLVGSTRGRFNSRRGGASSLDVRPSAASSSRRFTRLRSSSPGGAYGSSSFFGGSRGRGSSTRIIPTAASTQQFGGSRSRPGSYRSSFAGGGRSSSEYPYGRTSSSAALFAANSRYRIRPSSTSAYLRPTQLTPSLPPNFDRNTVEDEEDDSAESEDEEDVGTEREENTRVTEPTESTPLESALTPTTEGTTSPFRRPLFRLRRPPAYQPSISLQTTPAPIQRTTAARRLGLLRRPSSDENLPSEDRKPTRGRYKASSATPTKSPAKPPTTPRPRSSQPPRLPVLSRARPTSSLFPRRGLFRRPGEDQEKEQVEEAKEEESNEDDKDEIVEEAESTANEGLDNDNAEDSYSSDDSVADNDYEASEDVKSKNEPPRVFIRPFTPRRRVKRQAEYGTRGSSSGSSLRGYSNRFRRPGSSRKSAPAQEAEARVGFDEDEVYVDEDVSPARQSDNGRTPTSRSRNTGQQQPRVRPTAPGAPSRTQFTITGNRNTNTNNNNYRENPQRTNFRRPSTTTTSRRRNKGDSTIASQQQPRPKPPRLRTQSDTQQTATVPTKPRTRSRYNNRGRTQSTTSTRGRTGYRTTDLETNDYSTRRQYSSRDGKVTVTHQVPVEATIPVVNGKNTDYRKVVTASPSTQILTPGQYEATELSGVPALLLIGRDVTATPTPGIVHVTQYIARETPTSSVEFTPTVIRGRKTSFSHVVPSTAYGVEEVVTTLPSENGLLPSAPLANILLSQLLLGQFGLQGNVNPLLGLQQPNPAAALAPPTPTTEFKTRSTTYVTTLTEKTSTVIPITLRGKAIMTTIVDSSVQVVTATEFITDTIVVTPTAAPQQQLNSLLLPALLQAQLLNQQQQPQTIPSPLPGQLTPLQAAQLLQQPSVPLSRPDIESKEIIPEEDDLDLANPATERRKQPSSTRRRNRPHKRVEAVDEETEDDEGPRPSRGSTEDTPRPKTRKKQSSSGRKQSPQPAPKQYETSVITLYVSGRRPGDFSTVLSTISIEAGSSLVKREAIFPGQVPTKQYFTDLPSPNLPKHQYVVDDENKFSNSLPYRDPNIYLLPSTVNHIPNIVPVLKQSNSNDIKLSSYETESLESIVGDVSQHVVYHSSAPVTSSSIKIPPVVSTNEQNPAEESNSLLTQTGYFLADGPAELAPLKRKVLSIDEGVDDEEDFYEDDEENIQLPAQRIKRDITNDHSSIEESASPDRGNRRRRVRVRVPVRRINADSFDESSSAIIDIQKKTENDRETLLLAEAKKRTAFDENKELSDITSQDETESLPKATSPTRRLKVLRIRTKGDDEGANIETPPRGNKKRVKVLRRKKPSSNEEPNDVSLEITPKLIEDAVPVSTLAPEIDSRGVEKDVRGSSGRRRVVITKKRLLSSSAIQETQPAGPESSRRHRIVVTRRRPIQRQSLQTTEVKYIPLTASELKTQDTDPISEVKPTPTIIPISEENTETVELDAPPTEVPTARRVPSGGDNNRDFGSKKHSIPNSGIKTENLAENSRSKLENKDDEEINEDGKGSNEEIKSEDAQEEIKKEEEEENGGWVASLVKEPEHTTTHKSVEPSFWTREESSHAETELLRQDPRTSLGRPLSEETDSTPEGPRFVRPTRFSVTRRPSGDFLQKVQGLRTKAPIVFPSRRRASASTRQPAYRSRLSRLRGRPSSTSTSIPLEITSSVTSDITEELQTVEPTSVISIEPSSTVPPSQTPIYVTETLTETLLKTYTYVVSRVESSVEAGVDQAAAAPPSLAAVSSTTEVKQVVKTRTVTRLLEPTLSLALPEASIAKHNENIEEGQGVASEAKGRMNIEAARFNLATRIMSNGVEVIVAGDKTTLPGGPDVLRILSTASRPITLAPSTLSDQMQLTLPTAAVGVAKPLGDQESLLLSLQSQAANFVTKTYATTYTYLTTFLQGSSTVVSSREDVISNVVTEEVRPTKTIQQKPPLSTILNGALTSKVDGPPSFVTSTYRTTFTYLNTIIDGEIPVVLTTRQTVANTVTAPANPSPFTGNNEEEPDSGYLQPSEPTLYDTNTYFNTFTLTKTLSDSASGVKVISTEDILTQVVITEASTPAQKITTTKISPTSTTNIVKTYFVTYTYYNTFLEKGNTVVKTNVATSSDVVTEKFFLAPTKASSGYKTPTQVNVPISSKDQNELKTTEGIPTAQPPLSVYATKTYLTTFTYFTTLLENDQTVTRSNTRVSTNLATEAITAGLDSVYLDSLRSSFSMQTVHSPIIATVMLSGTPMEITAVQGSALEISKTASDVYSPQTSQKIGSTQTYKVDGEQEISPSKTTSGNVLVGSTIIFFDDIKPDDGSSYNEDENIADASSNSETISDDDETLLTSSTSNNAAHTDTPEFLLNGLSSSPIPQDELHAVDNNDVSRPPVSYITSTITASTVVANGNGLATTLVPGDAVIVSMRPDGNVSLIPVSDPSNKHPDGGIIGAGSGAVQSVGGAGGGLLAAAAGGPNLGVGDLINLGSLSLNGLNALGPVFNAMAGLLQNNLKSSPTRQNYTTTPRPLPTTPRTPPPIDLPRPPAPQSAPLIRDPVYIPVGGLASLSSQHSDAVAAESTHGESIEAYYGQNFAIHGFPDTQERRPPPSPVKPSMPTTLTLDNPLLLQNGIPIQPGQVITTNSDVIVGKPSVLGPRPSNNGGVPQIFPQNYAQSHLQQVSHQPHPLPQVHNAPPSPPLALASNHQPPHHYSHKPAIAPPPRVRPGSDVPPEMRPPPPPRFPSYSGVNPTRVSVVSGVETVFIGKPLPPHLVPESQPPTAPNLIQHPPTVATGPLRGDLGNYKPQFNVAPPIIIGAPIDNLNPQPAFKPNHNTIDRSTGYKIQPSQSFNIPIDAVTLSFGSETHTNAQDPTNAFLNIGKPLSGTRPGSVFNAGEPHSGSQLSLGQAQVHNVPMGTGGEVVVEIGRPPVTDILNHNTFTDESQIITNEDSSDENQGVVHEGDNLINRQPTIITHPQSEQNLHSGNIIVGHGRPQGFKPPPSHQHNYHGSSRPNFAPEKKPPPYFNHAHHPHSSIGAIHRPPPLSAVYTTGLNTHAGPADHLMPPPPPRPSPNQQDHTNRPHTNEGPIIIPLNHELEKTPMNEPHESLKPFTDDVIQHQWYDGADDDLDEPEDVEGAQDGEVLQESNNRPVRPSHQSVTQPQGSNRPNTLPDIQIVKEKPFGSQTSQSSAETHFPKPPQFSDHNGPVTVQEINKVIPSNTSDGTGKDNQPPKVHQQQFTLPDSPPYRFEIPDMQPPQLPPKAPEPSTHSSTNPQRPPPGAVSRPAIRPQDYNPDFLDKPIRIASRPQPPPRVSKPDGASAQENAVRPDISRPPVRVVVRPVNPNRPRPNYHNHHATQTRPSQVWPRPLRPLKPPGPVQVNRVPILSSTRQSSWQPAFSSTSQQKEITYTTTIPNRDTTIQPTKASTSRISNTRTSSIQTKPINPSFSLEREPIVIISSPSSSDIEIESSGAPILWERDQFTAIPTVELPTVNSASKINNVQGPTILLSGASTIYGDLYSRPTQTQNSNIESVTHGDLFLSPSSHGAIAGNGRPIIGHGNTSPNDYKEEEEELENEFEEGEGLGAAGSNDATTSIVIVSVTATPTTRYITRTQTETRTVTQTVVESHPGSPPLTRTVVVTQTMAPEMARPVTIVSTIVGTVTEVHTTVEASTTTAVTTVTVTAPTQWTLQTVGVYDMGHKPKDTSGDTQNGQDEYSTTSKPISSNGGLPSGSVFEIIHSASFPLIPGISNTDSKDIEVHYTQGDKDHKGTSDDSQESSVYEDDLEDKDNKEGMASNIIPNEVPGDEENYPMCKPECDAARNEICVIEISEEEGESDRMGEPHCACRPGFARLFPDRPCMPTYTYQLRLLLDRIGKHRLTYSPDLEDPQTEEFQQLHETAHDGLERVAMQSDIRDLFHGISIAGFESPYEVMEMAEESKARDESLGVNVENSVNNKDHEASRIVDAEDGVIVNFYVKLSDNMDPEKLKEMFEKTLKQGNYSVGGTELFARRKEGLLEIYDFDECSDPDFHDCSEQAQCLNLQGTYTCSCKEGFADLSENSDYPGRVCSAEFLGCEQCKYHGQCYTNTNGEIGCKCFQWYTGDKCQVNLKVLLIALVTVGAILLILVCVCIMFACMKRKKSDVRHTAPGFMRYRGPPGMVRGGGTLEKTAIIPDTSSESSFEGALPPPPLTYLPVVHHRLSTSTQASKAKGEGMSAERRNHEVKTAQAMGTSTMNTGFTEQDRSLTVMIPRAKYRPAPPLIATAAASSPMTSFGVVVLEGENRERRTSAPNEQKLLAFLDGTDSHNQSRQGSPTKQRQIGPTLNNHETSGNPKKISSTRKPSTGALISAGFEVSATVVKDKWPTDGGGNNIDDDADDTSGTGRGIDGHLHHTLASNGSHFTTLRTGDRTVSEARSYDETIVHPPKKSLLHTPLSACGSKPSSQHGLHHSNDEAHTMAERDVGSTFVMPQIQLYKPSRGSDNSNFDSL